MKRYKLCSCIGCFAVCMFCFTFLKFDSSLLYVISTDLRPYNQEFLDAFNTSHIRHLTLPIQTAKYALHKLSANQSAPNCDVLLLSFCSDANKLPFCQIMHSRLLEYAYLHGYRVHVYTDKLDTRYDAHWQKVLAVLRHIRLSNENRPKRCSVLAWFDDDTYITNLHVKIESFFDLADLYTSQMHPRPVSIILSRDVLPNDPYMFINAAVFLVRSNSISERYFQTVLDLRGKYPSFPNGTLQAQSLMTLILYKWFTEDILLMPMCLLQSLYKPHYWQWKMNDFVIHLTSLLDHVRTKHMKTMADRSVFEWSKQFVPHATFPCIYDYDIFAYKQASKRLN